MRTVADDRSKQQENKNTYIQEQINPILKLDYPDPDVIRVEDTYYMVSTTMHFMPGCEVLRSYDLVHWEHACYVYDALDHTSAQKLEGEENIYGKGMWAASIRYHKGYFYIFFVANDTGKTYFYQSSDLHGPWKKHYIEGFYHDCSVLFDDDRIYIVSGNNRIRLIELQEDLSGPKPGGIDRIVVTDEGHPGLGYEGSHFYKINGRYYLFFIHSLRTEWKRVEACFVANTIDGDFVGGDVLNDDRDYCNQGVAQGGIVDTPDGLWYGILFQDHGAVGRIPVLIPIRWNDGYPEFGVDGKVPTSFEFHSTREAYQYRPLVQSDDFKTRGNIVNQENNRVTVDETYDTFGFQSCWQINHEPDLSLIQNDTKKGTVEITTGKLCVNVTQAKNIFTQRMLFPSCSGEITVDGSSLQEGDYAGLCTFQGCYGSVALTKQNGVYQIVYIERPADDTSFAGNKQGNEPGVIRACVPIKGAKVRFRIAADFWQMKDEATFFYDCGDGWNQIGGPKKLYFKLDHFVGCRIGFFVYATKKIGGKAVFSDFTYLA